MKKIIVCLVAVLSLVLVTGCGKSSPLIGKWEGKTNDGMKTTFEFKKKDKVSYSNEYGINSEGTYKVKDDIVTISLEAWSQDKEYKFEVKNNKLSLTAQDKYSPSYKDMEKK